MAKGDTVAGMSSVAAGNTFAFGPSDDITWTIHNIYHEAEVELKIVEGGSELLFDSSGDKGSWSGYFFHLTNTHYMKVKNINATSKLVGYDGIVSK